MVARYNVKQNEIYQSSANLVMGIVYENASTVRDFFDMQRHNDSLARENADLRTQLEASKYVATYQAGSVRFPLDTSTVRPDTAQKKDVMQQFTYLAAEVVSNSIVRKDNYMTINRGSTHGVRKGQGVISPDGIVGIVTNVSPYFAQVMSLLSTRASISAMIKRNRYFGTVTWGEPYNPRMVVLDYVPKHAEVMRGDTIITSGFSEIFPGEVRIGRVVDFKIKNGTNFYAIDVELWIDLANIRYVYVVDNLKIGELSQFKQ
jgi:rod shape-determining protein MreC